MSHMTDTLIKKSFTILSVCGDLLEMLVVLTTVLHIARNFSFYCFG